MRRAPALAAAVALLAGACMVRRPDPVALDAFHEFSVRAASPGEARPSLALWISVRPFGEGNDANEDRDPDDRQRLLEVVRGTGWFADVRLETRPADLWLEARYREEWERNDDLLQLTSLLTLGLIPARSSALMTLDLLIQDGSGRVRGEVTRAERFSAWTGWIFLPFLFSSSLGETRADVRDDLTRAALAEARRRGWL